MSDEETFVLLAERLPAKHLAHKFLGRIVENFRHPTFGYRPTEGTHSFFTDSPIEVSEHNAFFYHEQVRERSAKVKVGKLFGLSDRPTEEEKASLKGKTVITRLLPQHCDVFDNMVRVHKKSITNFVERHDDVGYMVVGLKTIFNGTMERAVQKFRRSGANISLPTGAAVWAGTSGAVNLGSVADVDAELDKERTAKWAAFSQIEDEQIFAVQYRIIELTDGLFCGFSKPKLKIGKVMESWNGLFGPPRIGAVNRRLRKPAVKPRVRIAAVKRRPSAAPTIPKPKTAAVKPRPRIAATTPRPRKGAVKPRFRAGARNRRVSASNLKLKAGASSPKVKSGAFKPKLQTGKVTEKVNRTFTKGGSSIQQRNAAGRKAARPHRELVFSDRSLRDEKFRSLDLTFVS